MVMEAVVLLALQEHKRRQFCGQVATVMSEQLTRVKILKVVVERVLLIRVRKLMMKPALIGSHHRLLILDVIQQKLFHGVLFCAQ